MGFNLAWKHLIDSAQTASLGRLFQRGITLGKKEYLYAFEFANMCRLPLHERGFTSIRSHDFETYGV